MAYEVKLPRLGWDMEEGSLAEWFKKDGDPVNAGEALFSVEGDKAVQEIEALDSGILKIIPDKVQPGQKFPVGTVLGYLVTAEEAKTFTFSEKPAAETPAPAVTPGEVPAVSQSAGAPAPQAAKPGRVYISPLARRLAEKNGVDWRSIAGSGAGGRIMAKDVLAPIPPAGVVQPPLKPQPAPAVAPAPLSQPQALPSRIPFNQIRRKIAEQMSYSAHTSAPVTLTSDVDAEEFVRLRYTLKKDAQARQLQAPSYNDLLMKVCTQALSEHPLVNARIEGEEIVLSPTINIAVAVDSERGLIVPVVKNLGGKSLRQISTESAALIEKVRRGAITFDDLQGATFTITNLGMFDIDAFTPIIDLPQCAILGVGRITPKQIVLDYEKGIVAIHHIVTLSLTFDHRLIDGAQAARFLQRVKQLVETPYLWVAG